jgi:DMSO/TMAO reductase YedYZ heme-binding membrane subunit
MIYLVTLTAVLVLTFLLRTPLRKLSWLFYALALAAVVLFLARDLISLPALINRYFFLLMQKGILAEALFIVVMYTGVFAATSRVRQWLQPIRAQLSIIACILVLGHAVSYLGSFGARLLFSDASYNSFLVTSFCVSCGLLLLLLVLGATSFGFLKRQMRTRHWKRVQSLAYPFYFGTCVHVLLTLLPPALAGGTAAQVSVAFYLLLFTLYGILRLRRLAIDKKVSAPSQTEPAPSSPGTS